MNKQLFGKHKNKLSSILLLVLLTVCISAFAFTACDKQDGGEKPIESMVVSTLPKVEYYRGDLFELGDACLTVYYEGGKVENVPITGNMISDLDSNTVGSQVLTVFYKDKTAYVTVTVSYAPVYAIEAVKMPDKTTYVVGEELSVTGMEISVLYSNGFSENVPVTKDMVVSFSTDNVGETDMSILYGGKLCSVPYTVVKKSAVKINAVIDDVKKSYIVGDTLSVAGGRFTVIYNNAQEEVLDWETLYEKGDLTYVIDTEDADVFTSSSLQRTVTVYYKGEKYQYLVRISELKPSGITVISKPENQIMEGELNLSGAQLYVVYNTGYAGYTPRLRQANDLAAEYAAQKKWLSNYQRFFVKKGTEYTVADSTYNDNNEYWLNLEDGNRWAERYGVLYEKIGNGFVRAGETYQAGTLYYISENAKIIDFSDEEYISFEWNDFTLQEVGDYSVRVLVGNSYTDCTFRVVAPSPTALVVTPSDSLHYDIDTDEYYVYQDESVDYLSWSYQIRLNNGKYSVISSTGTYTGKLTAEMYVGETAFVNHKAGKYTYKFAVSTSGGEDLVCTVPVTVRAKEIVSAELVLPDRTVYSVGDELDLTGGKILVHYNSGDSGEWTNLTADMIWKEGESVSLLSFTEVASEKIPVVVHYVDAKYDTFAETEFFILVVQRATKIELTAESRAQTDYILGDTFSADNMEVRILFESGSPEICEDFSGDEWTFVGTTFDGIGQKTVRLYYGDVSDGIYLSFTCNVTNYVSYLTLNRSFVTDTTEGTDFDLSDIVLTVVRQNGSEEEISVTKDDVLSYDKAGVYHADKTYSSVSVRTLTASENWKNDYKYFYTKQGVYYVPAQVTDTENLFVDNNFVQMTVVYVDATNGAEHTVPLYGEVIGRKVTAVTVANLPSVQYTKDSVGDWDLTDLKLLVSFDNNTSALLTAEDFTYDVYDETYNFTKNDIQYSFTVEKKEESGVYTLRNMQSALALLSGNDAYLVQDLVFCVQDGTYPENIVCSDEVTFYCFERLVESVSVVFGDKIDASNVAPYADQTLYSNEGILLYDGEGSVSFLSDNLQAGTERRYVLDGSTRVAYLEHSFIIVKYVDDSTEKVIDFQTACTSSGFSISGYNPATVGAQTVQITYLLQSCTFTAKTRANAVKSIRLVDEEGTPVTYLTVVEGTDIDSAAVYVEVTSQDADGIELAEKDIVYFYDANCTYDKKAEVPFANLRDENGVYYIEKTDCNVSFRLHDETPAVFDGFVIRILKKSVSSLLMQIIPKQVYPEQSLTDPDDIALELTNASGEMGTVLVRYNNGTSEVLRLDDSRITVNNKQFKTKITPELTGGAEQSQTIYVRFTDENGMDKQTSYNVVVKDRKYLSVVMDESNNISFDQTFYCQYGTGENAGPKYTVFYYEDFYASSAVVCNTYTVVYENTLGVQQSTWPTEVGRYKMILSYDGDAANNAFLYEDVYVEILQREIGIVLQPKTITYGDAFVASSLDEIASLRVLDFDWEMQGIVNGLLAGSGTAYAFDDTDDDVLTVSFKIYDGNKEIAFFTNELDTLVVSCNVGTYTIQPIITLKKNLNGKTNYTVNTKGIRTETLTVSPMAISIRAKDEEKLYGQGDPLFEYKIFDKDDNLIGGCYYKEVGTGLTGTIDGNYYVYNTETYRYTKATGTFDSQTTYYTYSQYVYLHGMYEDKKPAEYRLYRESGDSDDVNEKHLIVQGSTLGTLDNYSVTDFTKGQIVIHPAPITVGCDDVVRPFGTTEMNFSFGLKSSYGLQNSETFADVFGTFFGKDSILYYNIATETVYDAIPESAGYLDTWAVLVKNVLVEGMNTIVYHSANYAVIPVAAECSDYVCTIDETLFNGIYNYIVSTKKFILTIEPISATLNVGSVLVYENSTVVDKLNRTLQSVVSFTGNTDLSLHTIDGKSVHYGSFVFGVDDRSAIDVDYVDWMQDLILGVSYDTGSDATYCLSTAYLEGYSFTKAPGTDTGMYRIMMEANVSKNFSSFALTSYNTKAAKTFVEFYYDTYKEYYSGLGEIEEDAYSEGAYVIVMPSYMDMTYYYRQNAPFHEEYSGMNKRDWALTTTYSLDKKSYYVVEDDSDSVAFSIETEGQILEEGDYTATFTYSFFADALSANKFSTDYIYRGSAITVTEQQWVDIVRYMFFGTIPENDSVTFSEEFAYTIDPYTINITFVNEDEAFGFDDKVLKAVLDRPLVSDDTLNCLFQLSALYNMKTEKVSKTSTKMRYFNYYAPVTLDSEAVFLSGVYYNEKGERISVWDASATYYRMYENIDLSYTAYSIYNAGTYSVTLDRKNIGNHNYALNSISSVSFRVTPISIPVMLYENNESAVTMSEDDFVFRLTYNAKTQNPIYSDWVPATYYEYIPVETTASLSGITSAVTDSFARVGTVTVNNVQKDLFIRFFATGTVSFEHNTFVEGGKDWAPSTAGETGSLNKYGFYYENGTEKVPVYYDVDTASFYVADTAEYQTYKTASCLIVPYYYNKNGQKVELESLSSAPNSLYIYADDGQNKKNYPKNVKRNPDNPEEVLGYDILFNTTSSDFNDYSVVFVYRENCEFYECDEAHAYSCRIEPFEVTLTNFTKKSANTKVYDGADASIDETKRSNMALSDQVFGDQFDVNAIRFTFTRKQGEGSTSIGGYELIAANDLNSCGEFAVTAYYSDNYSIVFGEKDKTTGNIVLSKTASYSITPKEIAIPFNTSEGVLLRREYNGLGLAGADDSVSGSLQDLTSLEFDQAAIVDNFREIYFRYVPKAYNVNTLTNCSTLSSGEYPAEKGYYWFTFQGLFVDKKGEYHAFADFSNNYANRMSWNYTYKSSSKKYTVNHGYDGIFQIDPLLVYVGIDTQMPTKRDADSFVYSRVFDGNSHAVSGELQNEILEKIQYYVWQNNEFVALKAVGLASCEPTISANAIETDKAKSLLNYNDSASFVIGESTGNYNIKNKNVSVKISQLEIEITVSMINADDGNSSDVTYGKVLRENALIYTFGISDEQLALFNSIKNTDKTVNEVLQEVLDFSGGTNTVSLSQTNGNVVYSYNLSNKNDKQETTSYVYTQKGGQYGFAPVSDLTSAGSVYLENGKTYYSKQEVTYRKANDKIYYNYFGEFSPASGTAQANTRYYTFGNSKHLAEGEVLSTGSNYYKVGNSFFVYPYRKADGNTDFYTISVANVQEGESVLNMYVFNEYYAVTEDEYFTSYQDYYYFTESTVTVGKSVQANTYYEKSDFDRMVLTDDLVFDSAKTYYVRKDAAYSVGERVRYQYYKKADDAEFWTEIASDGDKTDGAKYYIFTESLYSKDKNVTEYYYYFDAVSKSYKQASDIDSAKAYSLRSILEEERDYVSYYVRYSCYEEKYISVFEDESYCRKIAYTENGKTSAISYYRCDLLLENFDYLLGESIPAGFYRFSPVDNGFFAASGVFEKNVNYYSLTLAEGLNVGDDVSSYYVVSNGRTIEEAQDYFYYDIGKLEEGTDYTANGLVSLGGVYEKVIVEGVSYYALTSDVRYQKNKSYYTFAVAYEGGDYIFVEQDVLSYKKLLTYGQGKDYLRGAEIQGDVYTEGVDAFVQASGKYLYDVAYYAFLPMNGYVATADVEKCFVASADTFVAAEYESLLPMAKHAAGGKICFVLTEDEIYASYDVGDVIPQNTYICKNGQYVLTEDSIFQSGTEYFLFTEAKTLTAGNYYVPSAGYTKTEESIVSMRKAVSGRDYAVGNAIPSTGFYYEYASNEGKTGVMVNASSQKTFSKTETYYILNAYYGINAVNPVFVEINTNIFALCDEEVYGDNAYYVFTVADNYKPTDSVLGEYYEFDEGTERFTLTKKTVFGAGTYYQKARFYAEKGAKVIQDYYEVDEKGRYVLTEDTVFDLSKRYYTFTEQKLSYSEVIRFYEYDDVSGSYFLTKDEKYDKNKTYYYFTQSSASLQSVLYEKVKNVSSIYNQSQTIVVEVYYQDGDAYVAAEGLQYDAGKTYYTKRIQSFMMYDGASSYVKTSNNLSIIAGDYYIGGTIDSLSGNYAVKIIATPITVSKQEISVEGIERTYLGGKETWKFILSDDTEKSTAVQTVVQDFIKNDTEGKNIVDKTSVYAEAGSNAEYYMLVSEKLFRDYNNNEINNYQINCNVATDSDYYVMPLTINARPVAVSIAVKDKVSYGELIKLSVTDDLPASDLFDSFRTELTNNILDMDSLKSYIATRNTSPVEYSESLVYHLQTGAEDYLAENYPSLNVTFGEMTFGVKKKTISVKINAVLSYAKDTSDFSILYSQMDSMSYYDYKQKEHNNTDYSISFADFSLDGIAYSSTTMEEQLAKILENVSIRYYVYATQEDKDEQKTPLFEGDSVQDLYTAAGLPFVKTANSVTRFMSDLEDAGTTCEAYKLVLSYGEETYDSAEAFLHAKRSSFDTVIRTVSNEGEVYCGENRIKASSSLLASSANFEFTYVNSIIYIYPEIASIGDYADYTVNGEYIVGNTESVLISDGGKDSFSMNQQTNEITGLSFLVPLIMSGSTTPKQYYDTLIFSETESHLSAYPNDYDSINGKGYSRTIKTEYVGGGSLVGGKVVFAVGDVITVRLTVTEEFFNGKYINTVVSSPFKVRLVDGQVVDKNGGSKSATVLANKNDISFVASDNSVKAYNVSSSTVTGTYSLRKESSDYEGLYDILTLRLSLTPKKGADSYFFTANVYENEDGKLSVTFVGGNSSESYIRFTPSTDMLFLTNHASAKQDGTVYSTLSELTASEKNSYKGYSVAYAENNLGGKLYVKVTENDATVYTRAKGTMVSSAGYYLAKTASVQKGNDVSSLYVPYSEDYIYLNELFSIFDGRSHTISITLDKVGILTSLSQATIDQTCTQDEYYANQKNETIRFYTESLTAGSEVMADYYAFNPVSLDYGTPLYNTDGTVLYFVRNGDNVYLPDHYLAKAGVQYYQKVSLTFALNVGSELAAGTPLFDTDGSFPLYYICEKIGEEMYRFSKPSVTTADGTTTYYSFTRTASEAVTSNEYFFRPNTEGAIETTSFHAEGSIVSGIRKYYVYVEADSVLATRAGGTDESVGLFLSYVGGAYKNIYAEGQNYVYDATFFEKDGVSITGKASVSFENVSLVVSGLSIKSRKLATLQRNGKYYVRNIVAFPSILDTVKGMCLTTYKTQNETASTIVSAMTNATLSYYVLNGSTDTEDAMKGKTYAGEEDHNLVESILVKPNSSFTYRQISSGGEVKDKQLTYGLYKIAVAYTFSIEPNVSETYYWMEYDFMILPSQNTTSLQKYGSEEEGKVATGSDPITLSSVVSWNEYYSGWETVSGCQIADKTYYYRNVNGTWKFIPVSTDGTYEKEVEYVSIVFDEGVPMERFAGTTIGKNIFEYQNGSYVPTSDTEYSADKIYYSLLTVLDTNGLEGVNITADMNVFTFDYDSNAFIKVLGTLQSDKNYYLIDSGYKLADGSTLPDDYFIYDVENNLFEKPRALYQSGVSYFDLSEFGDPVSENASYFVYNASNDSFTPAGLNDYANVIELHQTVNPLYGTKITDGVFMVKDNVVQSTSKFSVNTTNYALSTFDGTRINVAFYVLDDIYYTTDNGQTYVKENTLYKFVQKSVSVGSAVDGKSYTQSGNRFSLATGTYQSGVKYYNIMPLGDKDSTLDAYVYLSDDHCYEKTTNTYVYPAAVFSENTSPLSGSLDGQGVYVLNGQNNYVLASGTYNSGITYYTKKVTGNRFVSVQAMIYDKVTAGSNPCYRAYNTGNTDSSSIYALTQLIGPSGDIGANVAVKSGDVYYPASGTYQAGSEYYSVREYTTYYIKDETTGEMYIPDTGVYTYQENVSYYRSDYFFDYTVGSPVAENVYYYSNGNYLRATGTYQANVAYIQIPFHITVTNDKIGTRVEDDVYVYDAVNGTFDLPKATGYASETYYKISESRKLVGATSGISGNKYLYYYNTNTEKYEEAPTKFSEDLKYYILNPVIGITGSTGAAAAENTFRLVSSTSTAETPINVSTDSLTVTYQETNVLKVANQESAITARTDALLMTATGDSFDTLATALNSFITVDVANKTVISEEDGVLYTNYNEFVHAAKSLFDGAKETVNASYTVQNSGIWGVDSSFMALGKSSEKTLDDWISKLSRIFGFSTKEEFVSKLSSLSTILRANNKGARTYSMQRRVSYDGAVYANNGTKNGAVNGTFVLPYVFKTSSVTVAGAVFVTKDATYIWVNDTAAVDSLQNTTIDVYGRSCLFEQEYFKNDATYKAGETYYLLNYAVDKTSYSTKEEIAEYVYIYEKNDGFVKDNQYMNYRTDEIYYRLRFAKDNATIQKELEAAKETYHVSLLQKASNVYLYDETAQIYVYADTNACSETQSASVAGGRLTVTSCECNIFKETEYSETSADMSEKTIALFDTLAESFKNLGAVYGTNSEKQMLTASSTEYSEFLQAVRSIFYSSSAECTGSIDIDETAGALIGITQDYTAFVGSDYLPSRSDCLTIVSRLFGFDDVSAYTSAVSIVSSTLSANGAGASTSSLTARLRYKGSIYTENGYVLPFVFADTVAGNFCGLVFLRSGAVSVWISDIEMAKEAVKCDEKSSVTLVGRCLLFDGTDTYSLMTVLDVSSLIGQTINEDMNIFVYNYSENRFEKKTNGYFETNTQYYVIDQTESIEEGTDLDTAEYADLYQYDGKTASYTKPKAYYENELDYYNLSSFGTGTTKNTYRYNADGNKFEAVTSAEEQGIVLWHEASEEQYGKVAPGALFTYSDQNYYQKVDYDINTTNLALSRMAGEAISTIKYYTKSSELGTFNEFKPYVYDAALMTYYDLNGNGSTDSSDVYKRNDVVGTVGNDIPDNVFTLNQDGHSYSRVYGQYQNDVLYYSFTKISADRYYFYDTASDSYIRANDEIYFWGTDTYASPYWMKPSELPIGQSVPKNVYVYNANNNTFTHPNGNFVVGNDYFFIDVWMTDDEFVIGEEVDENVYTFDSKQKVFTSVHYANEKGLYVRINQNREISGIASTQYTYVYDQTADTFTKVSATATYDPTLHYFALNVIPTVNVRDGGKAANDVYRTDENGNLVHDTAYNTEYAYVNLNHALNPASIGATLPANSYVYENGIFRNVSGNAYNGTKYYYHIEFGTEDYIHEINNSSFLDGKLFTAEGNEYVQQLSYDASKTYYYIDYTSEFFYAKKDTMYPREIETDIFEYNGVTEEYVKPAETAYLPEKVYYRKSYQEFSYFSVEDMAGSLESSTFIFDADFSDTSASSLWIYLGLSDTAIKELDSSVQGVQSGSGIGINVSASIGKGADAGKVNMSTKVYATLYRKPSLTSETTSYHSAWTFTYDDNEDKKDLSYIAWERGINILKVDYIVHDAVYDDDGTTVLTPAEGIIVLRLYQYYEKNGMFVTDLVWQEKIRNGSMLLEGGSSTITTDDIAEIYKGLSYQGITSSGVDLKVYSLENNIAPITDVDFIQYDFEKSTAYIMQADSSDSYGDEGYSIGVFVSGSESFGSSEAKSYSEGYDKPMQGTGGSYFVLSDSYSTPYVYSGNAQYIRFQTEEKVVGTEMINGRMRDIYFYADSSAVNDSNSILYQSSSLDRSYNTYLYYYEDGQKVKLYNVQSYDKYFKMSRTDSFYHYGSEEVLSDLALEKKVEKDFASIVGQIKVNGEPKNVYLYVKTENSEALRWIPSTEASANDKGTYYLYYYASENDLSETILYSDSLLLKSFEYFNGDKEFDIKVGSYLQQDVYLHLYDIASVVKNGIKLAESGNDSGYNAYLYYYVKESDTVYKKQPIFFVDKGVPKYFTYTQTILEGFTCDTSCDFMWYFASATPYIGNAGNSVTTRQRGCMILYTDGRLAFEVYKYNSEYIRQYLDVPSGFNFYDGQEHTISVVIAVDEEQCVLNGFLGEDLSNGSFRFYKVYVTVDGVETICYCPVINDLVGVSDAFSTSGNDDEGDADNNFLAGLYYTGLRNAQPIRVYDLYVYEQGTIK